VDLDKHTQQPAAALAPPAGIRASDADRDRTADILREALAEGRLDAQEHAERIDAVYRAKTVGELAPLVSDLPDSGQAAPRAGSGAPGNEPAGPAGSAAPAVDQDRLVAIFSSNTRKGRWRIGHRTTAFSLFGTIEIDLTEALFGQRMSVIQATSVFGNVEVTVPENISLRGNGTGVFGNFEVESLEAVDPEAPVVVVHGNAVFGNVEAKRKRGKRIEDLKGLVRRLRDS
jgi:hypothetical protein